MYACTRLFRGCDMLDPWCSVCFKWKPLPRKIPIPFQWRAVLINVYTNARTENVHTELKCTRRSNRNQIRHQYNLSVPSKALYWKSVKTIAELKNCWFLFPFVPCVRSDVRSFVLNSTDFSFKPINTNYSQYKHILETSILCHTLNIYWNTPG